MRKNGLWALAGAALLTAGAATAAPQVRIDSGSLAGVEHGRVVAFKGIPYAAPPVGDLRWAPPADPAPWSGVRSAANFGAQCPQPVNADGSPNAGGVFGATSEDCLYLNVWAPRHAQRAPVMVWVHGGSNFEGAGSIGAYDGTAFARDGVILVSLNYRLGALGFFAHPALTKAAAPDQPLVAYGVMDQIAALKWVKRNIAAFGGDPDNVTVFGESAGGEDTLVLMASPLARGLFAKAIVESGLGWTAPKTVAQAEAEGKVLARKAGAPADATLAQLRALPVSALNHGDDSDDFAAVVDGRLLRQSVSQAFASGQAARVPLIIGTNSNEASLMGELKLTTAQVLGFTPARLKAAYAAEPNDAAKARAIFTDNFMGAPARWIASRNWAGPSYLYHFDYVPGALRGKVPGAGHALEIPFVFDSWSTLGAMGGGAKPTAEDKAVTQLVHACWVAFAKTSAPACDDPPWPAYWAGTSGLMYFGQSSGPIRHFHEQRYDAQEAVMLPTLHLGN